MIPKKNAWLIVVTLGLMAGGIAGYVNHRPAETSSQEQQHTTIGTDAFSIRIFRNIVNDTEGNVLVAPHAINSALLMLQEVTGGSTREAIDNLKLSTTSARRDNEPSRSSIIALDINIPRTATPGEISVLPFSENFPAALTLFNRYLASCSPYQNAQFASSDTASTRTQLLAGCVSYHQVKWETPIHASNTNMGDFYSASGALPKFQQMRVRGAFRSASAEDGSWQAIVLSGAIGEFNAPLAFIGILPQGSARDFASKLTPELVTSIRKSLAASTPQDTLVELPRLEQIVQPRDMRFELRQLGLDSLFDPTNADFSPITKENIRLNNIIYACGVSIKESPGSAPEDKTLESAPHHISFNRPFIWLIADLSSDTPIEFIGLIEEM